jgi:hypothetical protein
MEPSKTVAIDADLWENTQQELSRLSTTYFNQDNRTSSLLQGLSRCKCRSRGLSLKIDIR